MPVRVRVPTNQGIIEFQTDRPPKSNEEAMAALEEHIASQGGELSIKPSEPIAPGPPMPDERVDPFSGRFGLSTLEAVGKFIDIPARFAGEQIQDITQPMLGPTGSALAATAADVGTGLAVGGGIGKAAKGLSFLARKGARFLPGAGTALREEGAEIVRRVPGAMRPSQSPENLFAVVEQMNPTVKLPEFTAMAKRLAKEEARLGEFGLGAPRVSGVAAKIKVATEETKRVMPAGKFLGDEFEQEVKFITESKDVPFQLVQDVRRRLGQRIGSLRKSTASDAQEQLGSFKQMFAALSKDLEKSADEGIGPAFQALKEANQAARRKFVSEEVDDLIQPALNRVLEGTDRTKTAFAKLLNDVREKRRADPLFASAKDSFVVKNLDDLEGTLNELRKLPIPPPPKGVFAGSVVAARRTSAGGLIGGTISSAMGMGFQPGAVVGGVGGIAVAEGISKLLQTQGGRQWLLNFVKKEPGALFNPKNFTMFSTVARAFSTQETGQ